MKGIEKLTFITDEQRELLMQSASQYKRHARIYFEVVSVEDYQRQEGGIKVNTIKALVKVSQLDRAPKKQLTAAELEERAIEVFAGLKWPATVKGVYASYGCYFVVVPFKAEDVVDIAYVQLKKEELGLTDADLSRLLNIGQENISRVLNEKRGLSKFGQAAFYYLFKSLEK